MKVNQDRVAVDDELRYRPMETCPLDCKVLLLTKEGRKNDRNRTGA